VLENVEAKELSVEDWKYLKVTEDAAKVRSNYTDDVVHRIRQRKCDIYCLNIQENWNFLVGG
jgi:hypothetical protein